MKKTLKSMAVGLALAAVLLLMNAGQARADIILSLTSVTPTGSDFTYTYSVLLTPGSVLHAAGGGANSGVERISAAGQELSTNLGRQRLRRHNHPSHASTIARTLPTVITLA